MLKIGLVTAEISNIHSQDLIALLILLKLVFDMYLWCLLYILN